MPFFPLCQELNNTKSTVCFVEPSGHGLSGVYADRNGTIVAFSPSSTEDATMQWSGDFKDFMKSFVLGKDNKNIKLHVFGQSTAALPVVQGLANLQAQKAIGIENVESLSLVSPLVKPRQDLVFASKLAGLFLYFRKTALPWQAIWQKPLDFSSSWEAKTKQPLPLALIFREGLTPQFVPSKVQIEKTQNSTKTIFQSIQQNKLGCVANEINILKAVNDDVVDNQSIVDLQSALQLNGCSTTISQSPKTAHNFAITSFNELVSHW